MCEIADKVIAGKRWLYGTKQYCIAATLDVKKAFNSASWHHTLNALSNINVPVYIQRRGKTPSRRRPAYWWN